MSEYVWMHSTAQAAGSASFAEPPQSSAEARARIGRRRFPPAKTLYRIALWMVAGFAEAFGRNPSSARSTALIRERMNSERLIWREGMRAVGGSGSGAAQK